MHESGGRPFSRVLGLGLHVAGRLRHAREGRRAEARRLLRFQPGGRPSSRTRIGTSSCRKDLDGDKIDDIAVRSTMPWLWIDLLLSTPKPFTG